jgi:hypothetical protein
VCGSSGCRTPAGWVKARSGAQTRQSASWSHRSRDGGTESSSGGVKWGTSVGSRTAGIGHKPVVAGRGSDVAIVSKEAGGQKNRWRSQLDGCVVSEAGSAAGRKSDYGSNARGRDLRCGSVEVGGQRRSRLTARLEPYWGKPAVRNLRGGGGNEVDGLMTICHDARKG